MREQHPSTFQPPSTRGTATSRACRLDAPKKISRLVELSPYSTLTPLTRQFDLFGINLVTSDEGAAVLLMNSLGATFPCTIVSSPSKQHVVAKSNSVIAAGDYKLIVKSRGGDAEGPLQTVYRNIKYIALQPVGITKVYSGNRTDYGKVHQAELINIEGWGLKLNEGDFVSYSGTSEGRPVQGSFAIGAALLNTDDKLTLDYTQCTGDAFNFDNGSTATLTAHGVIADVTFVIG